MLDEKSGGGGGRGSYHAAPTPLLNAHSFVLYAMFKWGEIGSNRRSCGTIMYAVML